MEKQDEAYDPPPPYTPNGQPPGPPPPYPQPLVQGGFNEPSTYAQHVAYSSQLHSVPMASPTGYYPVPQGVSPPPGTILAQPTLITIMPLALANPPPDYLLYSIMVTIMCCWPVGIVAILKSIKCRNAINRGNGEEARIFSGQAKRFAHIALGVGILFMILCSIYYAVQFVSRGYR
ncbi:proline-rich transmembrane protein 1-like [Lineus longissimus]|uniref:proline-rich transmembrane protein 1-like n=1 Tax=Lineus longissimus TaxID=88925 RepID=UPI002B4D7C13